MISLRIAQRTSNQPNQHHIELTLEETGSARQTASTYINLSLTEQEQEDLRWYLEEYLSYPVDPAAEIARRVEARMAKIGIRLFQTLLQSNDDVRDIWATLRPRLGETRVEVVTEVKEASSIPWELLRDPKTDTPLLLSTRSFVRAHPNPAQRPKLPDVNPDVLRILLVICRPGGAADVPFRSVASRIVRSLTEAKTPKIFRLHVLRPPTFGDLSRILRAAQSSGQPYHIVHFDGHGVFAGAYDLISGVGPLTFTDHRVGKHGYLLFENPRLPNNIELIDGPKLGTLLVETGSPVLVLNACRSAHNEPLQTPRQLEDQSDRNQNPHLDVRAFGSLAQEVMDAGLPGVVAMQYNVYVVTAAQFVADLYAALLRGNTLGEAVSLGRKQLHDDPVRKVIYPPRALQDWMVPVVYEAAPLSLVPKSLDMGQISIDIESTNVPSVRNDDDLPPTPDAGFYGRDETLLAIDRAFDDHSIVLLHALAGSGKTSAAAEFARWYMVTGGALKIIFNSFENYRPLAAVLDAISRVFADVLERQGIQWLALTDDQRRAVALQLLQQVRVLWVWDNVEPVTGFPSGTASAYTQAEQQQLLTFLRAARETGSKFLLTSRRVEYAWLGDLPARVTLPPMPMQERTQLAQAIAKRIGLQVFDIEAWRPLLSYTEGNPLTIAVLTRQALQLNLRTTAGVEGFIAQLRVGEGELNDNATEGRSNSLGASLSYGFASAFNKQELAQLAFLHFFQGFVDINVFGLLRLPQFGGVTALAGMTRESCIALFSRAADIGLLTARSERYYAIHPAVPWYLKRIFDNEFAECPTTSTCTTKLQATRGFVEAVGEMGEYYAAQYSSGNRDVVQMLVAEEPNLLHAMRLALSNDWWKALDKIMLGLYTLYKHTGRKVEWSRVVSKALPLFIGPDAEGPQPGREEEWNSIIGYSVDLGFEARDFDKAQLLIQAGLAWARRNTAAIRLNSKIPLTDAQKEKLTILSKWLHFLGTVQYHNGDADCVRAFLEDYEICIRTQNSSGAAVTAQSLGHVYKDLPAIRDLTEARNWYDRSIALRSNNDDLGRSRGLYQLSLVSYEEFLDAQASALPWSDLFPYLNRSMSELQRAIQLVPQDAVEELAVIHNQLGVLYSYTDQPHLSFRHFQESIRYEELKGNHYGAAQSQSEIALNFMKLGRLDDALVFAKAALQKIEELGNPDTSAIQNLRRLIQHITAQQSSV